MGLKQKLIENKEDFHRIFNAAIKKNGNFINAGGKLSNDRLIETHLSAWTESRINGVSASMAFYAEDVEAIKLIDKIAGEHFSKF